MKSADKRTGKTYKEYLTIIDVYTLAILAIYTLLCLVFFAALESPLHIIGKNILIAAAVTGVAYYSHSGRSGKLFNLLRKTYYIPIVFLIYSEVHQFIPIVNPYDYDWLLIEWDRAIFGADPTRELAKIATPLLTEYLQFAYMSFFFMAMINGIDLSLKLRDETFFEFARFIIFGFFLSYLMYFALPAVGPRFTLHDFASLNTELPGLWLTDFFRDVVNMGAGVMPGDADPLRSVNRDCMPSGHTWITLMNIILAFRYKSRMKYLILILGTSLIFATVYLRYHYVVDVMAGAVCALLTLHIEPKAERWLRKKGFQLN